MTPGQHCCLRNQRAKLCSCLSPGDGPWPKPEAAPLLALPGPSFVAAEDSGDCPFYAVLGRGLSKAQTLLMQREAHTHVSREMLCLVPQTFQQAEHGDSEVVEVPLHRAALPPPAQYHYVIKCLPDFLVKATFLI